MPPPDQARVSAPTNPTRFLPLAKAVLFGVAKGSLEIVGSGALPVIWPAVKEALEPVFARLEASLGFNPTASESNAEKAAEALEQDAALQILVEQSLAPVLAPLFDGQARLGEGQEQILQVLQGNDQAVAALAAGVHETVETLKRGVDLSTRTGDKLASDLAKRVLDELDLRGQADVKRRQKRESRFKEHVSRTQARAVELLTEGKFDRATDELRAGLELLEALIEEDPGDTHLTVQLGYFFKSIAQDFIRQNKVAQGEEYNDRALEIFGYVAYQLPHAAKSVKDYTDAINGLGNIHYARGRHRVATEYYRLSTTIDPLYCYAWHDLFLALYELARSGEEVDVSGMRQALDMTRRTGSGQPGLSAAHLEDLARRLDAVAKTHPGAGGGLPRTAEDMLQEDNIRAQGTLETARQMAARNPGDAEAQLVAAQLLLENGQPDEALASYEAAARLRPDSFRAASGRGAVLVGMNQIPEGLAELDRALQLQPGHPEPLYNRACARCLLDDFPGALQDLAGAILGMPGFKAAAGADQHLAALRTHPDYQQRFREIVGKA
jgi:tetratricopeptide (TPR) repeat protein